MPVVGKTRKQLEYRCDDGDNTLSAQEIFAMAVISISNLAKGGDNENNDEATAFAKLSKIGECWARETSSLKHSAFFIEATDCVPSTPNIVHDMYKDSQWYLAAEKYNWKLPAGYTFNNDMGDLDGVSGLDDYNKPEQPEHGEQETLIMPTVLEAKPLSLSIDSVKMQNQFIWLTNSKIIREAVAKLESKENNLVDPSSVTVTLNNAEAVGYALFDVDNENYYREQFLYNQTTKDDVYQAIMDNYMPIVGLYLYQSQYTPPVWACNDTYVFTEPEDWDETPQENKDLLQQIDYLNWLSQPCQNYIEETAAKISPFKYYLQDETTWTKNKLKELGFLNDAPGLTW